MSVYYLNAYVQGDDLLHEPSV